MTTPAGSPHAPIRPDWLARTVEDVLEPAEPIVDAHHHLFDRPGSRYLVDDYLADLGSGHDVRASVFVQARAMYRRDGPTELMAVGETEFANGVRAMCVGGYGRTRVGAAIVAYADLRLGAAVRPVLDAHLAASDGYVRGVRHIACSDPDPSLVNPAYPASDAMLEEDGFRRGYAEVARCGLTFDAWLYFHQLPRLLGLARAFPDVPVVIDHCGGILGVGAYAGRRDDVFSAWLSSMRDLAGCPRVHVKLGGLGMPISGFGFDRRKHPPSSWDLAEAWRPWMERCIELFGPGRCMFESNFPVDKGSYGYGVGWNALKRIAAGASADEKAALFRRTAARFYGLPDFDRSA